jgi:hypothetical protein
MLLLLGSQLLAMQLPLMLALRASVQKAGVARRGA